jgi:glycerol uptake facilitator-like aquaporin
MENFRHPTGIWWLVPIIGPHIGAICGAGLYVACVGMHLQETKMTAETHQDPNEIELKPAKSGKFQSNV